MWFPAFILPINRKILRAGKEDSYERNPGRVSFVFNDKFSELEKFRKLAFLLPKKFGKRKAGNHCGFLLFYTVFMMSRTRRAVIPQMVCPP